MKKINSIDYGARTIGIGAVFLIAIPGVLALVNTILCSDIIHYLILFSVGTGAVIEIGFFILLAVELRQDKKIDKFYTNNPDSTKTPQQILDEEWKNNYQTTKCLKQKNAGRNIRRPELQE